MQKVSYMGNGTTTEFSFNFPYYEDTNIIVKKNGATAAGYTLVGTSGGLDADIPYTGGKIIFDVAPTSLDSIVISRSLPLTRTVDYQPTAKIEPTTLNQDMNYMMEILKDMHDDLSDFRTQYAEIADKESTQTLLAKIDAIDEEITAVSQQIAALGDVSTITSNISSLQQSVSDLTTTVGGHTTSIGTLDTRTTGLLDYVVQSQLPTADNGYTWYRKYKSGWVEMGGYQDGTVSHKTTPITLPVELSNSNYTITAQTFNLEGAATLTSQTSTGFCIYERVYVGSWFEHNFQGHWRASGIISE